MTARDRRAWECPQASEAASAALRRHLREPAPSSGRADHSDLFEDLATSVELFESGFEHTTIGMHVLTEDGEVLRANEAFADLIGRHVEEIVGLNWRQFTHPVDVARIAALAGPGSSGNLLSGGGDDDRATHVNRLVRPDGSAVWAMLTVIRVQSDGLAEPVCLAQVVDITETVDAKVRAERLEKAVSVQEKRFHLAWEHVPVGMAVIDARGRLLDVNRGLCELTLRPRGELLNSSLADVVEHLDADRDGVIVRSDGSTRHVQIRTAHVENLDGSDEEIIQFVDITALAQHERAQLELLEKQRNTLDAVRSAERFRHSLISTVSHELRTPLSSMIGYLELLSEDGDLNERQSRLVDVVERSSQRLLSMVEDLLVASGLEQDGLRVHPRSVDVGELVGRVLEVMTPLAVRADIELSVDHGPDVGAVAGDVKMLERVLVNLASNGIKFTPPGGTVDIATRLSSDGTDVVVEVTDTGMGIPLHEQPQLFRRFFRTKGAADEMVPGSGLGLAITGELVRAHNGTIDLTSESGVGTTVTVSLPTVASARAAENLAPADIVADGATDGRM